MLHAPQPRPALRGAPLVPLWLGGLLAELVVGHLLLVGLGSLVLTFSGRPETRREDELKHTCGWRRCVVHYETCIQSLMAQVRDLRAQILELQRSLHELPQAIASTAGISQSYGDRMTQILSTLAKFNAVAQGYQGDSRAVAASVLDHLKMSNSNTAKCFSAVETLATRYAVVASNL